MKKKYFHYILYKNIVSLKEILNTMIILNIYRGKLGVSTVAQRVKELVLPQQGPKLYLCLGSVPGLGTSMYRGCGHEENKK